MPTSPQKGSVMTILLVIALIVAVGFGAFYYAKNGQTQLPNFNSTNSGKTPAPTATPDETASWKTYTFNNEFSFKHP
ncbi:MAG: hypothetical protein AAB482_03195, partial [Patescibacteria group bacterium]